jgi:ribosomal protein S1
LSTRRIENPEDEFSAGQTAEFKIIKLNLLERKIGLSIRALSEEDEPEERWTYTPEVATTSIGELAGAQLGELKKKAKLAKGGEHNDES